MRLYGYPETALRWADNSPETVGMMSRLRACFVIEERGVVVPLVEKVASTSIFWALLERWMPEDHAAAAREVELAEAAGDMLGAQMVRDQVQRKVCTREVKRLSGLQMVALVRDPVERFWSGWAHQCHRNEVARRGCLRRNVPYGCTATEAVRWLMGTDPGAVDEHFAPQWTTLAPGAKVHALTGAGVADFCGDVGLEALPRENEAAALGRTFRHVPERGGEAANEVLRWLYATDCGLYAQAMTSAPEHGSRADSGAEDCGGCGDATGRDGADTECAGVGV